MHHTKKLGVLPPPPPKFAQRFDFQRVTFSKRSSCKNKNVYFWRYAIFHGMRCGADANNVRKTRKKRII